MKRFYHFLLSLLTLAVGSMSMASCVKDPQPSDDEKVNVTIDYHVNDASTAKSSISTSIEDAVKTLYVAFYKTSDNSLAATGSLEKGVLTIKPLDKVACKVFAIANQGSWEWPLLANNIPSKTVSGFTQGVINDKGIPMAGEATWNGESSLSIGLDRLISKYALTVENDLPAGKWSLESVSVNGVNSVYPFKDGFTTGSLTLIDNNAGNDLKDLEAGKSVIYYCPEGAHNTISVVGKYSTTGGGYSDTQTYTFTFNDKGTGQNIRNTYYSLKLKAGATDNWSLKKDDIVDKRGIEFNPTALSLTGATGGGEAKLVTVSPRPTGEDFAYKLTFNETDRAAAGLEFSTNNGATWTTTLPNSFTGEQKIKMRSKYTGSITKTVKVEAISLTDPTFDIPNNLVVSCSGAKENNIELIKSRFENNRLPQDLKFKVTLYTGEELTVSTTTTGFTASATHNKGEWKWGWNSASSSWRVRTFDDSEIYSGWNTVSAKYVKGDITIQKELVFDVLAYEGTASCTVSCGTKKETIANGSGAFDNVFEISRSDLPEKPSADYPGPDEISIDISNMLVSICNKRTSTNITYRYYNDSEFGNAFTIKHVSGSISGSSYRINGDSIILPGTVRNTGCNLSLKAVFNDFLTENGREANMPFIINIL